MVFHDRFSGGRRPIEPDQRRRMIAEHSAFLSWALMQSNGLPRIPRRRVTQGGFAALLKRPGARAAAEHWWRRVLEQVGA